MVKLPSLLSSMRGSFTLRTRIRAPVVAGLVTLHLSEPSFGVFAKRISHVPPPSRESAISTLPITPLEVHWMPLLLGLCQVSPPLGLMTVTLPEGATWTNVVTVAVLLFGVGSAVAELTVAVLLIVTPAAGAVTVIVMGGAAPTGRLPIVQVIVPVPLHVHPAPEALTSLTPAGKVSVTLTSVAASGPALVTLSV